MKQHYSANLTRSFIAAMTGFNESYFSTVFHKETGWSFSEYLTRLRLDEAKRLLLGTTDSIESISMQTGFANSAYMSKVFRRYTGMPPSVFRGLGSAARIAAMQFLGGLMAVRIVPVAASRVAWEGSALLHDALPDMAIIDDIHATKQLGAVYPELIIASTYYYMYPDLLRAMEKIAPVILLEWAGTDKLDEVRNLGKLLHRVDAAERWVNHIREYVGLMQAKTAHVVAPEETVGIYEHNTKDDWFIPHANTRSAYNLYKLLGFNPPERIAHEILRANKIVHIDEEKLEAYAADHMFLIVADADMDYHRNRVASHAMWKKLVSERGSRLYFLPLSQFWMDDGLGLERQLEVIVDLLLASNTVKFNKSATTILHRLTA